MIHFRELTSRYVMLGTMLIATLTSTFAQNNMSIRGRIENITNYSTVQTGDSHIRRIGQRSTAPLPATGTLNVAVVLVQFADTKFSVHDDGKSIKEYYEDFCNGKNDNELSVAQYFAKQSDQKLAINFNVIGPVTLSKGYAYYGQDSEKTKDINMRDFYSEACTLASEEVTDWSIFDNDNDNKIDFIFFIYAGGGQNDPKVNDPNVIWPKENASDFTITFNGKSTKFGGFGCSSELAEDNFDGIGTMCHELSHGFGLPDLYDTEYNGGVGMGYWDIMDSGCYIQKGQNPIAYSAYERDFMGWRTIQTVESDKGVTLTLKAMEDGGTAYKIVNKSNPNEYFILENRQPIGNDEYLAWPVKRLYDTYGALHGLMITHVDYVKSAWVSGKINNEKEHQRLTIVPADGELYDYYTNGGFTTEWCESMCGDLYPGSNKVTEMSSYATFTGGTLDQTITNIREENGIIYVDINGGAPESEPESITELTIEDGKAFSNATEHNGVDITYIRTFSHDNWQALYVPFAIGYDDWKNDFEIAMINDVNMYDTDNNGTYDYTEIEILKLNSGTTAANTPYFIRAKEAGSKTITVNDATLYPTEVNSIDCSSTTSTFVFTGTYDGISGSEMYTNHYYGLSDGMLCTVKDETVSLRPLRWFMEIKARTSNYSHPQIPAEIKIRVANDDATQIDDVTDVSKNDANGVYTLDGRRITTTSLPSGIYIKNGKKFVVSK